jgi:hypothetical protein
MFAIDKSYQLGLEREISRKLRDEDIEWNRVCWGTIEKLKGQYWRAFSAYFG